MAKTKGNHKNSNNSHATGAVAAAAAVAAVAGAIFLYGTKRGAQTRRRITSWALKAKADVLEKLEQVSEITQDKYNQIVDTVMRQYTALKHIDPAEIKEIVAELREHWTNIQKQIKSANRTRKNPRKTAAK